MIQNNMLNLLMNKLQFQNPAAYNQIQQWMSSGKDPQQIINSMIQNNQITPEQLNRAQGMVQQMKNQKRF